MNTELQQEGIIKEEAIGYLKSKANLMQGNLYLTPKRLVLDAHKTGVSGFGILGAVLKRQVEKKSFGFNLQLSEIKIVARGKHGRNTNVLEITDQQDETFRILVKNVEDWKVALKQ